MDKEAAHITISPEEAQYMAQAARRRRNHKIWLVLAAAGLLAIAFGVGLGVGLNKDRHQAAPATPATPVSSSAVAVAQPAPSSEESNLAGRAPQPQATTCPYKNLATIANNRTKPTSANSWWKPAKSLTWQIVLTPDGDKPVLTYDYAVYDLDVLDNDAALFADLHKRGKKVICYFSAGTAEDWRDDYGCFKDADKGKELPDWPGERWLRYGNQNVRNIMLARLDIAQQKGCDAVDPDNMDGYDNQENGLGLTVNDSISYMTFLSDAAHARNMAVGLKNAGKIVGNVLDKVEFQVNEECLAFNECKTFQPFIAKNKPVFHIEYPPQDVIDDPWTDADIKARCAQRLDATQNAAGFSTVLKNHSPVDEWIRVCAGAT